LLDKEKAFLERMDKKMKKHPKNQRLVLLALMRYAYEEGERNG